MTGPLHRTGWRAVEIGPGGIPPESVRPSGPGAPARTPDQPVRAGVEYPESTGLPPAWAQWSSTAPEPGRQRNRSRAWKIAAALATVAVLVGLALWSNAARPLGGAQGGQVAVGNCLSSTDRQIDGTVSCGDPSADFLIVGKYPDTADANECTASPADLAVVQIGPTLLCLNYVAVAGDCLLLGRQTGQVGKVDCGSDSAGRYRVRVVLKNTIDAADCPTGTTRTLVHRFNSEVLCLSR